jgi:O-antigen/teichoic acid export membrane protein
MVNQNSNNALWLYIQYLLKLIILFILNILIARQFGVINFGIYNYIFSFFSIFLVFISFGIDDFVIKELIFNTKEFNLILGTVFILRLVGSFFAFLIISIIILYTKVDEGLSFYLFLYLPVFTLNLFNLLDLFYRSRNLPILTSYASIIAQIIAIILYSLLFYFNFKFINIFYILFIEGLLYTICLIFFYTKYFGNIYDWKFNKDYLIHVINKSWPLFITAIFVSIISKIDQIFIKYYLDFKNVGLYSISVRIAEAWFFIMIIYSNLKFPNYLNNKYDNNDYHAILKKMFYKIIIICSSFIIFILVFSKIIILKVYGIEYLESVNTVYIYVFSSIPISFGLIWSKWIISENKLYVLIFANCVTLISNVGLNIILIPLYGIFGAAISNVISYFAGQIFGISLYKKEYIFNLLFQNKIQC